MQNVNSSQHPVEYLFSQLDQFGPYPKGVQPTSKRIEGLAFFPGGAGLSGAQPGFPLPPMPVGGVMVLGHIFNTVAGYDEAVRDNRENENSTTWKPLLDFLSKCPIAVTSCFFTNGYMGLKQDSEGSFGAFFQTLLRDQPDYIKRCRGFLLKQIQAQQPRLLLVLGKDVWPILTHRAPELTSWSTSRTFRDLDERNDSLVRVQFDGLPHHTVVVAHTQPVLQHHAYNVENRIYERHGDDAETALVLEGWNRAQADAPA
jgi:hypothetical protein